MQEILNAILETGVFPRELVIEKATIIPKSCKAEGPKDTRMISVANSLNGLLSALISARLRGALEPHLDDGIGGCRPGRGCLDQIAAVKYATVNAHLEGKVIIASLTDMSKFFDTIGNDLAETLLIKFLGHGALTRLITKILRNRWISVAWRGIYTEPMTTKRGTPQGNPFSVYLPNIILSPLIKLIKTKGLTINIAGKEYVTFAYVDDMITISYTVKGVRDCHAVIEAYTKRFGLRLNPTKHQIAIWIPEELRGTGIKDKLIQEAKVFFPDAVYDTTKATIYLGYRFGPDGLTADVHVNAKIKAAKYKEFILHTCGLFTNAVMPRAHRALWVGTIRPSLVYALEVSSIFERHWSKLEIIQHKNLAHAIKQHKAVSRNILYTIFGLPSVQNFVSILKAKFWASRFFADFE
ncbi:MAG: hypothetical protein GY737_23710, partial [Desulfobacteraceae bacterium]|nr:hypothetical protein [Desulfobacteraceae bacterium]